MYEFEHSDSSGSVVDMFAVLSTLEKASTSRMNLTRDSHADLIGELKQWLHITSNLPEGRWQRDRNFTAARTDGVIEASSISCEGVVNAGSGPIRAGGTFPHETLSRHLKRKEMYQLYHLLR